jgi:polysaccharide biosynthesis protein PslH
MQRSYYLMREVARHHDLAVIAFRQRAHQPDEASLEVAKSAISKFANLMHVSELPEDRLPGGRVALALRALAPGPPYTIRWGMSAGYRRAVQAAIADYQPDVVHFDTVSLAPYLDLVGEIPAVLNHHNIESHMLLRRAEQEGNPLKRWYFWQEGRRLAAYERGVSPRFRTHVVCADLDAQRLAETVGKVPTRVVPNGADLDYFQPGPSGTVQEPDSMIFVGGLSWYPNASAMRFFVREVWPIIATRRPSATLRIIGRNPPADLQEAAASDPRIKVMGFVDDMRHCVGAAMVYVCPIFEGGGTRLKMIDAMAMGKAIVAHPVAAEGLGLIHEENVLLADSPKVMAEECIRVFEDDGLRQQLGEAARVRAEQAFGFCAIGRELSAAYAGLA